MEIMKSVSPAGVKPQTALPQGRKPRQKDRLVSQRQFIKGPVHVGRHPQSQVFLPHPSVSRQHLVIFLGTDGQWRAKDLQSANKTLVNGKAISEVLLKTGDHISVGQYVLLSHIKQHTQEAKEQSSIIAPILAPDRIMGAIYLDSKPGQPPFSTADLDYAVLVAINLAVMLENY